MRHVVTCGELSIVAAATAVAVAFGEARNDRRTVGGRTVGGR